MAVRQRAGGWRWLAPLAVQGVLLVVLSLLVFLPFHLTFKSLVGGDAALGAYVLQLIPAARFQPAIHHGCRVRVWARWPFHAE